MSARRRLVFIKTLHTVAWAFFVAFIAAIWVFALLGDYGRAAIAISIVSAEVVVLALNRGRCPLSAVARRYTADAGSNFDIYLPAWVAGHTKLVFGALYGSGIALTLIGWSWHSIPVKP